MAEPVGHVHRTNAGPKNVNHGNVEHDALLAIQWVTRGAMAGVVERSDYYSGLSVRIDHVSRCEIATDCQLAAPAHGRTARHDARMTLITHHPSVPRNCGVLSTVLAVAVAVTSGCATRSEPSDPPDPS